MGDAADDLFSRLLDQYDDGYDEDRGVTCKHCGAENLRWLKIGFDYVLVEGDTPHVCAPSTEGFTNLDK